MCYIELGPRRKKTKWDRMFELMCLVLLGVEQDQRKGKRRVFVFFLGVGLESHRKQGKY